MPLKEQIIKSIKDKKSIAIEVDDENSFNQLMVELSNFNFKPLAVSYEKTSYKKVIIYLDYFSLDSFHSLSYSDKSYYDQKMHHLNLYYYNNIKETIELEELLII